MLEICNYYLMIFMVTISIFMLTRYVFLEPGMEERKQRVFYAASCVLILIGYLILGANEGQIVPALLGALNIVLGRKKHRFTGMLLVIPLLGIVDGAVSPLIFVQYFLQPVNETLGNYLIFAFYVLLCVLLLLFYFRGKQWRRWFAENMKNRSPLASEYIILCLSGILSLVINSLMSSAAVYVTQTEGLDAETRKMIVLLSALCALTRFALTLTIVVLIMQGNRRKFYHDRVSSMQFHMIATMSDIVENRDSNTGGHIKRTAKYVEIIGTNLRKQKAFPEVLTDQYLENMIVAAPLHDIGKISIPDAILNKPGRLTDEEFAIMKTHTTAGRDALRKAEGQLGEFEYLNIAQDMAQYHHEWWNGNGYPEGISGEEIPLCARIMAVADVFDALTSKRCYKDAMPLEKAYDIIRSETGTHFDPLVGETFLNSRGEIEKAMKELSVGGE